MARILVVDDDEDLRRLLIDGLEGHDVATAANGREALHLARNTTFDLVITDLIMPEMEGIETIIALRKLTPTTPIVAISGGGWGKAHEYLSVALQVGASKILPKPFTQQALLDTVSAALAE